jgi:ribosome modulation factor
MMNKNQLAADANENPDIWYAGYDASNAGKPASACPYDPRDERMMNVWLSGHVTATDERERAA